MREDGSLRRVTVRKGRTGGGQGPLAAPGARRGHPGWRTAAARSPGWPRHRRCEARATDLDRPSVVGLGEGQLAAGRSRPSCRRSILGVWHSRPRARRLPRDGPDRTRAPEQGVTTPWGGPRRPVDADKDSDSLVPAEGHGVEEAPAMGARTAPSPITRRASGRPRPSRRARSRPDPEASPAPRPARRPDDRDSDRGPPADGRPAGLRVAYPGQEGRDSTWSGPRI